ncbi:hypothetical protein RvY_12353 [Ramazzottius varieornatus]|uniref:Arf-GAP domain-containing protein n=1 Tax=Ramazzottius varieornatus TaxID=947166 RepID=A0A1D1VSY7_RAMVA|nr:hypothetical protein RvY_12353 [Ramazzottius varieornatus]
MSASGSKQNKSRGNQICADCSASDPTWASLNRGVLICDECCSIHRILGRHISLVKALKRSPWAPSQLLMVTALYQKGANLLWEHALFHPANSSPAASAEKTVKKKPLPKDPVRPNKEEFIRKKYQLQSFIHRPGKDESPCSSDDLSQQLHSSVRTSNIEITLRLLCLGADPNYWHPEKGNRPLHVAARAGQWSQVELLVVYGADPGAPDISGMTAEEHAKAAGIPEMADRLVECQYELTDRLAAFICNRKPDHSSGQHFIMPELTRDRSVPFTQLAKAARKNLRTLDKTLFEHLAMDVYDEVDRQETENIWQSLHGQNPTTDRHMTAFLPVNPRLSAVHNQARQKLARLHPSEFAALIVDVLAEVRRRQTGVEKPSPTLEFKSGSENSSEFSISELTSTQNNTLDKPTSHKTPAQNTVKLRDEEIKTDSVEVNEEVEPLYDQVAVDEDYVNAEDEGLFGLPDNLATPSTKPPVGSRNVDGALNRMKLVENAASIQCTCEDGKRNSEPCPVCDSVVTMAQYLEMKKALRDTMEREDRLTNTVFAMKEDLNRLLTQVGSLLSSEREGPHPVRTVTHNGPQHVETTFISSLRNDSGIQEYHDGPERSASSDGLKSGLTNGRHSEGVSLPSLETVNIRTGPITQTIHELKRAVEAHDGPAFKNCITKIHLNVTELIELFRPSQASFPEQLSSALAEVKHSANKLMKDGQAYLSCLPASPERRSRASYVDDGVQRAQATQVVMDNAYSIAMSLKDVLILHSAQMKS